MTLIGPDGIHLELPGEIFEVLREVVAALSQGLAITVAPHQTVLSTREAAQLIGVSRPTLVRLLESGEIPFGKPGRHRRVRLADLLAYQQRSRRRRATLLDEMVAGAEQAGPVAFPMGRSAIVHTSVLTVHYEDSGSRAPRASRAVLTSPTGSAARRR